MSGSAQSRNQPPRGKGAQQPILIIFTARSPERERKTRVFQLTKTYMDAGDSPRTPKIEGTLVRPRLRLSMSGLAIRLQLTRHVESALISRIGAVKRNQPGGRRGVDGRGVREMDSKSGKSWLFGLGREPAWEEGGVAVGTNTRKVASRALMGVFFHRRTSEMENPDHSNRKERHRIMQGSFLDALLCSDLS